MSRKTRLNKCESKIKAKEGRRYVSIPIDRDYRNKKILAILNTARIREGLPPIECTHAEMENIINHLQYLMKAEAS